MADPFKAPDARAALFGGGLSAALLVGAWVFQYGFGYAPCIMCYWQRYAHMAVIATAVAVLGARAIFGRSGGGLPQWLGPLLLLVGLLVSAGLGAYHVGVEFGLLEGPQACAVGAVGEGDYNLADPLAALDGEIKGPSCADVVWSFLGVSMAGWNAILSLLGALGVARLGLFPRRAA